MNRVTCERYNSDIHLRPPVHMVCINAKCFYRFNCYSFIQIHTKAQPNVFFYWNNKTIDWNLRSEYNHKIQDKCVCVRAHSEHFSHSIGLKFPFVSPHAHNTTQHTLNDFNKKKRVDSKRLNNNNNNDDDDDDDNEKRSHQSEKKVRSHKDIIISDHRN